MQIVCPQCAAGYEVPETLLARRKPVRCARCGDRWLPEMPAADVAAPGMALRDTVLPAEAEARPPPEPTPWPSPVLPAPVLAAPLLAAPVLATPVPATPVLVTPLLATPVLVTPVAHAPVAIPVGLNTESGTYEFPQGRETRDWSLEPPGGFGVEAAWVVSIAAVALALVVLFADHKAIAQDWPPVQRLYSLVGLR